jgi:hypothetical protein
MPNLNRSNSMITRWERIRRQSQLRREFLAAVHVAQSAMLKLSPEERESVIAELLPEFSPEEQAQLPNVIGAIERNQ